MPATLVNLSSGSSTVTEPNGDFIITVDPGDVASYTVTAGTVVGGFGNRQITLGAGNNTLTLNGGTNQITATTGNGNNTITATGSGTNTVTLAGGDNTVSMGDGANAILVGNGANTITTGLGSSQITVGDGIDTITTNGGNNTITVSLPATAPATPDTINANASDGPVGGNTLVVKTAGTFNASLVNGIETYQLANGGLNNLVLADANFVNLPATPTITVDTGDTGGVVNAATVSTGYNLIVNAGTGVGILTGGSGTNTVTFDGTLSDYTVMRDPGTGALLSVQSTLGPNTTDTFSGLWNVLFAAPAPTDLDLTPGSDSGISNSDDITNVTLPVITGSGVDGSTVTLFDATTVIGTGTVTDGVWSITATSPLAVGNNAITATQITPEATNSVASTVLNVILETTAPAPSAPALTAASDSGISDSDDITNVSEPTVTGTGISGDTITLFDGSTSIGTGAITNGTWSIVAAAALVEGSNVLTAQQTDVAGNVSVASPALNVSLDTIVVPPADLALTAPENPESGANVTTDTLPTITGTGENGAIVTLFDDGAAAGTATVANGIWSIADTIPLTAGTNSFTASQTDVAGNLSTLSTALDVTLDPNVPNVTAALVPNPLDTHSGGIVFSQTIAGGGDPNLTVTITEGANVVATTQADATGAWTFDPSVLSQGAHTLVASETNTAGNTGSTFPLTSPDMRFHAIDETTSTAGSLYGTDYTGPVGYLQSEYAFTGSDTVVISANVANVFIHGGSADEAFAAVAGSNVLQGGTGSNWLVGATGADGGTDTFFVDNRGGQSTWDTLLNFHIGDSLTVWGFDATSGSMTFADNRGTAGYQGETLQVNLGNGTSASSLVTFAGLSSSSAHLSTGTGTSGGIDYLSVTRTS